MSRMYWNADSYWEVPHPGARMLSALSSRETRNGGGPDKFTSRNTSSPPLTLPSTFSPFPTTVFPQGPPPARREVVRSVDDYQNRQPNVGVSQDTRRRRYSDQDQPTRQTRTEIRTSTRPATSHRSTESYPTFRPNPSYLPPPPKIPIPPLRSHLRKNQTSLPASLPFRSEMQPQSASKRSSLESRHKTPLSVSTSAYNNYASSGTSEDSLWSRNSKRLELTKSRAPFPPISRTGERGAEYGPPGSPYAKYGTLVKPQRLSMAPPSLTPCPRFRPWNAGEGFRRLPEDILLVILGELKQLHLEVGSLSCATCLMRDLVNVGFSCKKWCSAARVVLYQEITLNGCDSVLHTKKRYKMKYGTRLKLLRRTLRERPDLAENVKSLKVPSVPEIVIEKREHEDYIALVASLVMACPNLERLPGFYPNYNHTFSRFFHALSTRTKLTEAVWIINPSPFQRQRRYNFSDDTQEITPTLAPAPLLPEQYNEFLSYHTNWTNLSTLFLHCQPGATMDSSLFTEVCTRLPLLDHLHVSSFPPSSFNDSTLASLPPLKSLRLDSLPGITAAGLWSFASLPCSAQLTSLSLVSIPLLSLPALARLLSRLSALTRFTISQASSPTLPDGEQIYLHPYLAASSLQYLHWELTNTSDTTATSILSKSIAHGGFPALRTIRAPTDLEGSLQQLCKPRDRIELPGDRYRNFGDAKIPSSQSLPTLHHTTPPVNKPRPRSNGSLPPPSRPISHSASMSLVTARRMAQHRLDACVFQPRFHIIVWGDNGTFLERQNVGGFMGAVESRIFYSLRPDVEGMDEAIVRVEGMGGMLDGGEETSVRDGCSGSWNRGEGRGGSGKERERWWHTERGRWREVKLEKFF